MRCWRAPVSGRCIWWCLAVCLPGSLASRIEDAEPVAIVGADAGSRGGIGVPYKPPLDEAIRLSRHKPASVLPVDRGLAPMDLVAGRDHLWALREQHLNASVPCEWVDSRTPANAPHQRHHRQSPGVQRDTAATPGAGRQHEDFDAQAGQTYFNQ